MNTETTNLSFVRVLNSQTFRNCLAQLTCDDAQVTNVVHKYAAFEQLSEIFNVLVNCKYNKEAWLSVTTGLQYLVQAIDDYAEDDTYDWQELLIPDTLNYFHFSELDIIDRPFQPLCRGDVLSLGDEDERREQLYHEVNQSYMATFQGVGISTDFFRQLCHNYIEVLMNYNSECGLTSIGNKMLAQLIVEEDFPEHIHKLLPDAETSTICLDFDDYDLDDTEVGESEFFTQDDEGSDPDDLRASLESLLNNSLEEAVMTVALRHGLAKEDGSTPTFEESRMYLIGRMELDESIVGDLDDYVSEITDEVIDLEEELRSTAQEQLQELESRCHEAFLVTLIEKLRVTKPEPLKPYGFDKSRVLEITGGNKLPIYPEFYENVQTILSTFLDVSPSQIRMILEGDFFVFTYMTRLDEMEIL